MDVESKPKHHESRFRLTVMSTAAWAKLGHASASALAKEAPPTPGSGTAAFTVAMECLGVQLGLELGLGGAQGDRAPGEC